MGLLSIIAPELGPLFGAINIAVDRLIPDTNAAAKLKSEIELELSQANIKGVLAQLEINRTEAGSNSMFVAGWRPWIGWVGGTGFAVQFVVCPLVGYIYSLFGHAAPPVLELDPILYEVVFGILGINIGARSYDKAKGTATKGVK